MWLLLMKELIRILFFTWITFRKKWWNNLCGKSEYNIKRTRKRYCIVICREIEYTDSAWCCFSGCQFATPLSFMLCPLLTTPDKPEQTGIYENFFSPAFHGQPADLPDGRGNFFLSHLHGIILAIFQKCPKRAQKNRKPIPDFLFWCAVVYVRRLFNFLLVSILQTRRYCHFFNGFE